MYLCIRKPKTIVNDEKISTTFNPRVAVYVSWPTFLGTKPFCTNLENKRPGAYGSWGPHFCLHRAR